MSLSNKIHRVFKAGAMAGLLLLLQAPVMRTATAQAAPEAYQAATPLQSVSLQ
ncbi:MAG: hypothetical protein WAU37_09605 [Formosimonas sp.]|jgi:hypothetical protein